MNKVFIEGLHLKTVIGVLPEEQDKPQDLWINLEASIDLSKAAKTDDLKDTIDYTVLRQHIVTFAKTTHYQLVETFAERLASHLISQENLTWLRLKITKKPADITDVKGVGVILEYTCHCER